VKHENRNNAPQGAYDFAAGGVITMTVAAAQAS